MLYHFSEDPFLTSFAPRAPVERPHIEPMVWAIDEWHAPMYYFPRDCPRACFWPSVDTTAEDRDRWFAHVDAQMVIAVESAWLGRIRATRLYRYAMPPESFVLDDAIAGHWVGRETVAPLNVNPVGDLLEALAEAHVELRITPNLHDLWQRVIATTLAYSGTRLRNATGWPAG